MASFRIPTRNKYGFSTGIWHAALVSLLLTMVLTRLLQSFLAPAAYQQYLEEHTLPAGSVGTAAGADVPAAQSLDDLDRLDRFTIETVGSVLNYDHFTAEDGTVYHYLMLPSGELVYARVNLQAVTGLEEKGRYRLPVGCWREWPGETPELVAGIADAVANGEDAGYYTEQFGEDYPLRFSSRYVDMYGDHQPVLSEEDFQYDISRGVVALLFAVTFLACSLLRVLLGQAAPVFWSSRDPLLPRNDLECWCASTFALWAASFPALEGWPLITGGHRSLWRVWMTKRSLREQWGIRGRKDGIRVVEKLIEEWAEEPELLDDTYAGWDLCRATQLLGMMYLAGYISRKTLDLEFSRAGGVIQQRFSGWEALTDSYLLGCIQWLSEEEREKEFVLRRDILLKLRATPCGPYTVPWDTDLSWAADGSAGGRAVVKEVLARLPVK